jgi:hypothetical protein
MSRAVVVSFPLPQVEFSTSLSRLEEKTHNDFTVPGSHNFNLIKVVFLIVHREINKDFRTTDSSTFYLIKMLCMFASPWDSIR